MATIFNPWESPPSDSTLKSPLASFDINDMDGPAEKEHDGAEGPMAQALAVIQQQSDLISQLMKSLGTPK